MISQELNFKAALWFILKKPWRKNKLLILFPVFVQNNLLQEIGCNLLQNSTCFVIHKRESQIHRKEILNSTNCTGEKSDVWWRCTGTENSCGWSQHRPSQCHSEALPTFGFTTNIKIPCTSLERFSDRRWRIYFFIFLYHIHGKSKILNITNLGWLQPCNSENGKGKRGGTLNFWHKAPANWLIYSLR